MSNPLRPAHTTIDAPKEVFPDALFKPSEEYEKRKAIGAALGTLQAGLEGLDMEMRNSFVVPRDLTLDESIRASTKPKMALAKKGAMTFRQRSAPARSVAMEVWRSMEEEGEAFFTRSRCVPKIKDTFYVDAGTEHTIGRLRKAYPRRGARVLSPITEDEAAAALDRCGLDLGPLPDEALRPYPLVAKEGDPRAITVNPRSDNGFPVLAQWCTPGAPELVLGLARTVREELVVAARKEYGVREWLDRAEKERPWLVALRGKAKADYYSNEKLDKGMMRFYNAFPRQMVVNMQVATQVLEALSRNAFEHGHSGIGVSLVHGGADRLVAVMETQLGGTGHAYVHVGDDSFVVKRVEGGLVMFALDCSNFDLTQHADATLQVHLALWRQLRRIDGPAADLWFAYARSRLVVVANTLVCKWRHAGPSGMPLQSKVNDMLMDVLISRALAQEADWTDAVDVDALLVRTGKALGFEVRVEQHVFVPVPSLREALARVPFLFVGYYFYCEDGMVRVCADLPRTLSQLPYPSLKWIRGNGELKRMEAMRIGSMLLSLGVPPARWRRAFEAWRAGAVRLIDDALASGEDVADPRLRWAVGEVAWGPETVASLGGLRAALLRDPEVLWLEPRQVAPVSQKVLSWADAVEEEEEAEEARKQRFVPPASGTVRAVPAPRGAIPTHPTTLANFGRPPPTAVWKPDRPPTNRSPFAAARRVPRRRGVVLHDDPPEEWYEVEDSSEYEFDRLRYDSDEERAQWGLLDDWE